MTEATQTLPENYTLAWDMNLKTNRKLNWLLQILALIWFVVMAAVLTPFYMALRADFQPGLTLDEASIPMLWVWFALFLGSYALTLTLHELSHGLYFWYYSGARPKFGVSWGYAYAGAPEWYFPKRKYMVIALAPLFLLTTIGTLLFTFVPTSWLGWLYLNILLNAGGAIGDLAVVVRLLREPESTLVNDVGDGISAYRLKPGIKQG